MIAVTALGGAMLVVNVDLIVTIEQTPDTVITLINGDKLMVRESPAQLVSRTVEYRRRGHAITVVDPAAASEAGLGR